MDQGEAFKCAFLREYEAARARHSPSVWQEKWSDTYAWSRFVLYPDAGHSADGAVLRATAADLGLKVHPGEPLRLDAVLSPIDSDHWFPVHVAVEHENAWWTLGNEIRSLLTVRARLKVAITYCLRDGREPAKILETITHQIRSAFHAISRIVGEDPNVEYLFLIGMERDVRKLEWLSLSFTAKDGPDQAEFR